MRHILADERRLSLTIIGARRCYLHPHAEESIETGAPSAAAQTEAEAVPALGRCPLLHHAPRRRHHHHLPLSRGPAQRNPAVPAVGRAWPDLRFLHRRHPVALGLYGASSQVRALNHKDVVYPRLWRELWRST